jgi:hypothetical protein
MLTLCEHTPMQSVHSINTRLGLEWTKKKIPYTIGNLMLRETRDLA